MNNQEYAASLRLMADFFESHPEVETPSGEFSVYSRDLKRTAASIGSFDKVINGTWFELKKTFGPITVSWFNTRSNVCERVSKGTKIVPETIIPARPEQIIPAHEVEEFEWKCPESLLAGDK